MALTFEEKIHKIESFIAELQGDKVSLAETLKRYEEGIKLIKECETELKELETKITELKK